MKMKNVLLMEESMHFIRRILKTNENDVHRLWVNKYGHNEYMNWWQGEGFLSVGAQMGAIKLAMAGT